MPDRPPPPELEFETPPCPICQKPTEYNDGFDCVHCGASWTKDGTRGEWDNPEDAQCTAAIAPWRDNTDYPRLANEVFRCFLADGHEAKKHTNPECIGDWSDTDKHAFRIEPAAVTPDADR